MSDHKTELLGKLASRTATVGVIGLGYVGLPLALVFEEAGFPVLGFDVDAKKPEALHRGESYIKHIGPECVASAFARGRIAATTDFARRAECDAILICVPTPLGKHRGPDISDIKKTAESIAVYADMAPETPSWDCIASLRGEDADNCLVMRNGFPVTVAAGGAA